MTILPLVFPFSCGPAIPVGSFADFSLLSRQTLEKTLSRFYCIFAHLLTKILALLPPLAT
ncbi:hypothetical protein RchiOBHm_Chr4g0403801 [Rosa chinensis]|uniref:Uncharacterized protein n=1 Tax=Rosa chinensis TaxID=74649 RepID=A0A2P6QTN5_ROSCH|nr:hypothetical protein RchiOBHm_Chr4g0403801 [Rosa chinensis]